MEHDITSKDNSKAPLVKEGVFLSFHSSFNIGGEARYFIEARSVEDIREAVQFAHDKRLPIFVLGGGSNTVFPDSTFEKVVLKNCLKGIEILNEDNETVEIKVYAGEHFDDVVEFCVTKSFYGIENLTSIPGTMGGAIVQNIGAYGAEIKDVVVSIEAIDINSGAIRQLSLSQLGFGYRDSVFKKDSHRDCIIVSATLRLHKDGALNLTYKDLVNFFEGREISSISPRDVRTALQTIRGKKFPDLTLFGTAGSFFKNCIITQGEFDRLKTQYPDVPHFYVSETHVKVPTAWLLDKVCGLRGYRDGNMGLFENQSLVVVNFGNATANELKEFVSKIKKIVFEKTTIILEEEVIVL